MNEIQTDHFFKKNALKYHNMYFIAHNNPVVLRIRLVYSHCRTTGFMFVIPLLPFIVHYRVNDQVS